MVISQDFGGSLFREVAAAHKEGLISTEEANAVRGEIKKHQDVTIKEAYRDDRKTLRNMQIDYSHQEESAGALLVREEAAEIARRLAFKPVKEPVEYSPPKIDEAKVSDETVLEYWQCGRKTQFDTVEVGQKTINSQKETETMSVYQCGHCPKFHIGHGFGRDSVASQLVRAREHWMKFPEKSNMFAFAKGLI